MADKKKKKSDDEWFTGKKFGMGYYIPGLDKKLRKGKPHSTPEGRHTQIQHKLKTAIKEANRPLGTYSSGGKATRGYGKAYMKGGRAK